MIYFIFFFINTAGEEVRAQTLAPDEETARKAVPPVFDTFSHSQSTPMPRWASDTF